MIIGFIGQRGSGKTLTMVRFAYEKYLEGYKIYSNINLNFPHETYTVDDLLDYAENGKYFGQTIFIIDEVHILFDSRSAGKKRNRIFSYFLNQSSKNALDVYYTTQFSRQVELRLRLNTEIVIQCNCKVVVYKTKFSNPIIIQNYRPKNTDYKAISYIQCTIHKFSDTGLDTRKIIRYIGNKYFKLYNTKEVVILEQDKYERVKEDKQSYKEKRAEQKLNNQIHKDFVKGKIKKKYDVEVLV